VPITADDGGRKNPVVLATDEQGGDVAAFQPFRADGLGGIAEKFGVGRRLRANHGLKFSLGAKIGDRIGSMEYQIQNRDIRGWRSRPSGIFSSGWEIPDTMLANLNRGIPAQFFFPPLSVE